MPSNLVAAEEFEVEVRLPEGPGPTSSVIAYPAISIFQCSSPRGTDAPSGVFPRCRHVDVPAVRPVKDVGAGGLGRQAGGAGDRAQILGEDGIIGDVSLRVRQRERVVELSLSGEPDDLWQRLLPRPADSRSCEPPDAAGHDERMTIVTTAMGRGVRGGGRRL